MGANAGLGEVGAQQRELLPGVQTEVGHFDVGHVPLDYDGATNMRQLRAVRDR